MPELAFSLGVEKGSLGMMLLNNYYYILLLDTTCYDMLVDSASWY